jgi:squalene-hopene/tetraprenyl-beta-curcumene cyclase
MPSGWPDTDDTAGAVVTLAGLGATPADPQLRRGLDWLRAMQNRDGSWGCFARDAGVSMDAPCAVMTAHAAIALHAGGLTAADRPLAATVRWFGRIQRRDGAFANVWFRGLTCGTARVLDALGRLGLGTGTTARRAHEWLLANQHPDGGWGDGTGAPSSVEETAWAVLGLVAVGAADTPAVRGGVEWLLTRQRPDGRWPATFVGIYFLGLTYWCDHIADGFALQALARYRTASTARTARTAEGSDARL